MFRVIFYLLSIVFFFVIGFLQFFGVSLTLVSYSLIMFISFIMFSYFLIRKKVPVNLYIKTNLIFFCVIVVSAIINSSHIFFICYYLTYIMIPIVIYLLINRVYREINLYNLIVAVSLIQFPVLILQYLFPDYITYSVVDFHAIDRLFGTFPLKADHFLGFFLLMTIFYLISRVSRLNVLERVLLCICVVLILLGNSTITKILLFFTLFYYMVFISISRVSRFLFYFFILLIFSFSYYYLYDNILDISTLKSVYYSDLSGIASKTANRFQTIYYFLVNPPSIFGNGPCSYYNPITNTFLLNANFSQLIWSYYDLGISGLLLTISLPFSFISLFSFDTKIKMFFIVVIISYSLFANLYDQIVFLLTLNIFTFLFEKEIINNFEI